MTAAVFAAETDLGEPAPPIVKTLWSWSWLYHKDEDVTFSKDCTFPKIFRKNTFYFFLELIVLEEME
jgi:hypothetical protein